jgi:hypothetical protein
VEQLESSERRSPLVTAYNKIKHNRDTEYHRANLKNVLDAVAGLFVVCVYLYKEKAELGELVPSPAILRPSEERFGWVAHGGYEFGIKYKLEDSSPAASKRL